MNFKITSVNRKLQVYFYWKNLLRILLEDEKKTDKSLYSAAPYWDYKTKNGPKIGNSLRVHFPIQVDEDCIFTQVGMDGKEIDHRLKTNNYYYMDKRKPHWVKNNSENYRFHVIMDLECEQKHLDSIK